ncbi:hypothetical protein I1E95_10110 [Synechococcus sp. CBW1107]|uniref:hypothetical protein n=1 Tax=Synechococcus sp. CBW1107 TaxID=2789857 RepID=UPI0018CD04BF|nr:hypothetical protein [Synechococcus sp. CBW1107]QPN55563.1 hypothetical protein I1E95_10110 [Synechococcus sp. CBW1107]
MCPDQFANVFPVLGVYLLSLAADEQDTTCSLRRWRLRVAAASFALLVVALPLAGLPIWSLILMPGAGLLLIARRAWGAGTRPQERPACGPGPDLRPAASSLRIAT